MATTTLTAGTPSGAERGDRRASELADFLRDRRSRIAPESAGFPRGRRRRTRGLRREEVAQLAGVSVTWYTWLEQARAIRVSDDTLDALARALRLTPEERAHIFLLALGRPPADPAVAPDGVPRELRRLVERLGPVPAYVMGPFWELLASNPAANVVFGLDALAPGDRNMLWYMFGHPDARRRIVHWEDKARRALARFRAGTARLVDDPRVAALVDRLAAASAEFAAWWPRHDILGRPGCRKEILHPEVGELVFEHSTLLANDLPELQVVFYAPLDEADTAMKLRRLLDGAID